mgnify:CR=1 FL=1
MRFHLNWVWDIGINWLASEFRCQFIVICKDVARNIAFCLLNCFKNQRHLFRFALHFNNVTVIYRVAANVNFFAVNSDVRVRNKLARSEYSWREVSAVYNYIKAALKKTYKVFRAIAFKADRFFIYFTELTFTHVVVTFKLLLSAQLKAEI